MHRGGEVELLEVVAARPGPDTFGRNREPRDSGKITVAIRELFVLREQFLQRGETRTWVFAMFRNDQMDSFREVK